MSRRISQKPNKGAKSMVPFQQRDRVTRAPVAKSVKRKMGTPSIKQHADGSVRIKHREYVTDVTLGVALTSEVAMPINPGLAETFPWLSEVALNFESYRMHNFKVESLSLLPTSAGGYNLAGIDFDALDPVPASKQALANFDGAQRSNAWDSLIVSAAEHQLNKLGPQKYIRYEAIATSDRKTYDSGVAHIWHYVSTGSAGDAVAEVWVSYDVTLYTPQLRPNMSAKYASGRYGSTTLNLTNMSTGWSQLQGGELIGSIAGTTDLELAIRDAGYYLLELYAGGSGVTGSLPTISGGNDAVVTPLNGVNSAVNLMRTFAIRAIGDSRQRTSSVLPSNVTYDHPRIMLDFSGIMSSLTSLYFILTKFSYDSPGGWTEVYSNEERNFKVRAESGAFQVADGRVRCVREDGPVQVTGTTSR